MRQPEAFAGWFRRIVWSTCGRFTRRSQIGTTPLDTAAEHESREGQPAETAEKAEMREVVLRAINALPPPEREATTLFYINGYSQQEVADFLEVPVTTVKNRLRSSRGRLKERMLAMVKDTLHENAPDERFSQAVIEGLLARPNLLETAGHPVLQVWDDIRTALSDYEVVSGEEVESRETFKAAEDQAWNAAYRLDANRALRFQTTTVTMTAIRGRRPPVRLLTAGRVFRPSREAARHSKVFHQVDGVCIAAGADVATFKVTCERALKAAVPGATVGWRDADFGFVSPGFEADLRASEVLGGGMLKPDTLRNAGFDPTAVTGFAWGLGLERLAMIRFGIDDMRKLWQPPYVS